MERLDRLERVTDLLLVLLDTPRPLSLREIADRVPGYPDPANHAALRQAFERDKRLLRDEGVPVESGRIDGPDQVGYRIEPDAYFLPDLAMTPEEQAALNLAVAGVHGAEATGRSALSKLGASVARSPRAGGGDPGPPGAAPPVVALPMVEELAALPLLYQALAAAASLTFLYRGEERHVDPASLRFRRGRWYLLAHDRDRDQPRTFRVDRIGGLPEVGPAGSSNLPPGFDPTASLGAQPWRFAEGEELAVDVVVDARHARAAVRDVGEEAVAARSADGSVTLRLAVTDLDALLSWVLGFLDHAEIVAPPRARAAMVARLEATATHLGRLARPAVPAARLDVAAQRPVAQRPAAQRPVTGS
jgi:proteasome accessory factor B